MALLLLLLLLFLVNTSKQFIIGIPLLEAIGGFYVFRQLQGKARTKKARQIITLLALVFLALVIMFSVIGVLYLLR
jgi:hypothetical protein